MLTLSKSQKSVLMLIFILAAGRVAYELLVLNGLRETAALFIGLPAFLAVLVTILPSSGSAVGITFRTITIALALAAVWTQEGVVCLICASPLLYAAGFGALALMKAGENRTNASRALVMIPVLILSLEGVVPGFSPITPSTVSAERLIAAPVETIEKALARPFSFQEVPPAFLRVGFPTPVGARGRGSVVGDRMTVTFAQDGEPAEMVWVVSGRGENWVAYDLIRDNTHIAGWLTFQSARVSWTAVSAEETRVTWSVTYARGLAPGWYFGPLEDYAVGLAAGYLAEGLAH